MSNSSTHHARPGADPGVARWAGFTVLEMVVAIAIIATAIVTAGTLTARSQRHQAEELQRLRVSETGWRCTHRIAEELRGAVATSISPDNMTDSWFIQYRKLIGLDTEEPTLGPTLTIEFELVFDEDDNGLDDNGDGRIDEGRIVYGELAGERRTLAEDILDLRFHTTARGVEFSVDVGVVAPDQRLIQGSYALEVSYRN